MSAINMPTNRAWKVLQNRKKITYYIILTVRGKEVRKEFSTETKFNNYKRAYEIRMADPTNGIERLRVEIIYE